MVFGLFRSKASVLKEKIIFTQKNRIGSLENELEEVKRQLKMKDDQNHQARGNFERSKDRLVEQIIDLSDKFADINQRMLDMAAENASLKYGGAKNTRRLEDKSSKKKRKNKK
ncbi:MAG: hypothetical protein ACE5FT_01170 [Candidatus Nanoarchaeia archaeon]